VFGTIFLIFAIFISSLSSLRSIVRPVKSSVALICFDFLHDQVPTDRRA
jgi:hypothetical protein